MAASIRRSTASDTDTGYVRLCLTWDMGALFRWIWRLARGFVLANVAAFVAVNLAKRSMRLRDDPGSDEFDLVSVNDGVAFSSESSGLRFGSAFTGYGSTYIDLRDAKLDEEGADLRLTTWFGNTAVVLPADADPSLHTVEVMGRRRMLGSGERGERPVRIHALTVAGELTVSHG